MAAQLKCPRTNQNTPSSTRLVVAVMGEEISRNVQFC